jgi:hypothetical protein
VHELSAVHNRPSSRRSGSSARAGSQETAPTTGSLPSPTATTGAVQSPREMSREHAAIGAAPPAEVPAPPLRSADTVGRGGRLRGSCDSTVPATPPRSVAPTKAQVRCERPTLTGLRRPAPAAPVRFGLQQLQGHEEDSLMRPGDEETIGNPVLAALTPHFPFPVRIPSFLLDEHLQIRGKEFISGIATSFHIDQIQDLLL